MSRSLNLPFWVLCACFCAACAWAADPPAVAPVEQASLSTQESAPAAQVVESSFDFGEVHEGKDYVHDFRIKNVGTAELSIKKVLPG